MEIVLMVGTFALLGYFMIIRPQTRQLKEREALSASLAVGERVLLGSGTFATIHELGERQAVVELSPGVLVTVLRSAILRKVDEAEDEFVLQSDEIPGAHLAQGHPSTSPAPVASDVTVRGEGH